MDLSPIQNSGGGRSLGGGIVQIDVIEFELICRKHGVHKTLIPSVAPRPLYCAHCFLPVEARRELRRFAIDGPLPSPVGTEAWIG